MLVIHSIKGAGDIDQERVLFMVSEDCDLGVNIVALSRRINESSFSSNIKSLYWFPDKEVKKGDLVVLYTKSGESNSIINNNGKKTHFFYWGLSEPISVNKDTCVVLLTAKWRTMDIPLEGGCNEDLDRNEGK
ncbi:MAG: hypothetical protein K2L04_05610 [Alistipes sp.]|nr:hypothetical protein [Alistipes sp.]